MPAPHKCPYCAREFAPHVAGCFAFDELPEDPETQARRDVLGEVASVMHARVEQLEENAADKVLFKADDDTFAKLMELLGTPAQDVPKFRRLLFGEEAS